MRMKFAAITCILLVAPCICFAQPQQTLAPQQTQSSSPSQSPQSAQSPAQQAPIHVDTDVMAEKLVHMVPPVYPQIALMAHVAGTVVLRAVIATDGTIRSLTFISGPVLLRQAAMLAVERWRFQPTLLNGQPVEVETTIPVNFWLPEWQHAFKFKVNEPGSSRVTLTGSIDLGGSKKQDWNDWIAAFENAISRAWLAGTSSAAIEKKGKVTVEFTLLPSGKIDGVVAVTHPSGDSAIDDATRLAVQKCAQFQALPANANYSRVRITFVYDHPQALASSAGATQ